jgi:GAF domain-containing protein
MTPRPPTVPARLLARLVLIRFDETDLSTVFHDVVECAQEGVATGADASITIVAGSRPHTAAFTSDTVRRLDELQYQYQRGPCLQAVTDREIVLVRDTARDARWNRWPEQAAAAGAGSVLSVPLPILDDVGGALNMYGGPADAFDEDAVRAARSFADHAAAVLANAHLYERTSATARQLEAAMVHRAVIEQAKGIIMAERRCTAEEAFAVLTKISQDSNRKLREVAALLVAGTRSSTGE